MTDYWKKCVTYWKSRQARRSLKSKNISSLSVICTLNSVFLNVSAMSYKICRNVNIQRNVKYRPVEKTWHIVFIQTCFHEIVSTAFTDFSRGGKRIKDILYIVLHRTWSIYSILSTDLCSFWSSDAGKSVAEASARALHVVLQTPTQIS